MKDMSKCRMQTKNKTYSLWKSKDKGEKAMDYILMHEDAEAAYIKDGAVLAEVLDDRELPVGVYRKDMDIRFTDSRFKTWLGHRTIPNNRVFGDALKRAAGLDFPDLMLRSMAISLTDTYWLKPEKENLIWKDINFHDVLFSNDVGRAVVSHCSFIPTDKAHPTFTTDGMLEKTWIIADSLPYLLKFHESAKQTAGEVFASRVARMLGVSHVPYNHVKIAGRHACICPCVITDSHTDMVYAMQYKWEKGCGDRELYDVLAEKDTEGINSMLAFDELTCQYDRHLYNFAFADGRLLPLYDSGRCLVPSDDTMPFCRERSAQLKLIKDVPFKIPDAALLSDMYKEACGEFEISPGEDALRAIKLGVRNLEERQNELEKQRYRRRTGRNADKSDIVQL